MSGLQILQFSLKAKYLCTPVKSLILLILRIKIAISLYEILQHAQYEPDKLLLSLKSIL